MKLSDFSVINYRSITTARKIHTNNMTVLVGKNNEGKSNILRALTLAMDIMKLYAMNPRMLSTSSAKYTKSEDKRNAEESWKDQTYRGRVCGADCCNTDSCCGSVCI